MINDNRIHRSVNFIGLLAICLLLSITLFIQFPGKELPCPLCLLQRICFIAVGLCCCMNLRWGIKPAYYGLMALASLLGFLVSLRQVMLHLAPDDPGYGQPFLGLHLYTWSAILFIIILMGIAIGLLMQKGFRQPSETAHAFAKTLIGIFLLLILANGISTFVECGFSICPANPMHDHL